jgi:hypothetical protein
MSSSASTFDVVVPFSASTTQKQVELPDVPRIRRRARKVSRLTAGRNSKSVQNAIYSYIRAIRALGRDKINTIDIAEALSLTVPEVNHAISALEKKGVKVVNG